MNKAYKIKLYPTKDQIDILEKSIRCSRFVYNQMLGERIAVYEKLKEDREKLYSYEYKTEKEYKQEFPFLEEVSSYILQQSRRDLETSYKNFFRKIKQKKKKAGFPKFKSKKLSKQSFRMNQTSSNIIQIKENKLKLSKYGWFKFRGLSNNFDGVIKSVTVTKLKDNTYEASILVDKELDVKHRINNNQVGIDLGIKEFLVASNGDTIKGIKDKLFEIEKDTKKLQKHFARKENGSKRKEKLRIKIAKLYKYKTNFQNHFFWHLSNKLCSENQVISLEDLNVAGMIKNRKLAHSIYYSGWSNFVGKLKQKAIEYDTTIVHINRFFPSSKLCSSCGCIKEDLTLSDRTYTCECGLEIDRDLNAGINILKAGLNALSLEYSDYRHGENVRPREIIYNFDGRFSEKCLSEII